MWLLPLLSSLPPWLTTSPSLEGNLPFAFSRLPKNHFPFIKNFKNQQSIKLEMIPSHRPRAQTCRLNPIHTHFFFFFFCIDQLVIFAFGILISTFAIDISGAAPRGSWAHISSLPRVLWDGAVIYVTLPSGCPLFKFLFAQTVLLVVIASALPSPVSLSRALTGAALPPFVGGVCAPGSPWREVS